MKFTCTKQDAYNGLMEVSRAIQNRSETALKNAVVKAKDDKIIMMGSDAGSFTIVAEIPGTIEVEGSTTIDYSTFSNQLKFSEGDIVSFVYDKPHNRVNAKCGTSDYTISTIPFEDYPVVISEIDYKHIMVTNTVALKNAIKKTIFACEKDSKRIFAQGMYVEIKDNSMTLTATNAQRIAKNIIRKLNEYTDDIAIVVPYKIMDEVYKMLPTSEMPVEVATDGTEKVRFKFANLIIYGSLFNIKYPVSDVNKNIPNFDEYNWIELNANKFNNLIKQMLVVSEKDNIARNTIDLSLVDSKLKASVENEITKADDWMDVVADPATKMSVRINGVYFMNALNVIDSENVKIGFDREEKKTLVLIPSDESEEFLNVIARIGG